MHLVATAVDYSGARPSPALIKSHGYDLVLRYLGDDWKGLQLAERDALFAAGLRIALLGQRGAVDRPRGGCAQGKIDGEYYEKWANFLGWPDNKPIICAIADVGDPDGAGPKAPFPLESDLPAIREYLRGIDENNRRPLGIYGPYWVLEAFRGDLRVTVFMQSAGGSGSGQGTGGTVRNAGDGSVRRLSSLTSLYQEYGGVVVPETDHNQVFDPNFERWTYHPSDGQGPVDDDDEGKYDMTTVFCKGVEDLGVNPGTGFRVLVKDGKRYREGYNDGALAALDRKTGVVQESIELHGDEAKLFLTKYPELGYDGPRLVGITGDTDWGREVAGLAPGEMGRFYVVPNRYTIRVKPDPNPQWNANRFVGIPHIDLPEAFMWNQPLVEWSEADA